MSFVLNNIVHALLCYVFPLLLFVCVQLDVVLETNKSAIRVLEAVQKKLSQ